MVDAGLSWSRSGGVIAGSGVSVMVGGNEEYVICVLIWSTLGNR